MNISKNNPIVIEEQGSFAVGGTVITNSGIFDPLNPSEAGQTMHVDHLTTLYQIPQHAHAYPLVFWHGVGQTMRTWQTTPDGREGFQNLLLRKHYPVYLIDQPRRGQGGRTNQPITINATADEQYWFARFRLGTGTDFFEGVQFAKNPKALEQFFRQFTPDIGPIDVEVNSDAVSALFNKIGQGVLITHSHSGGQGWLAAIKNSNIKGIVSYEPGSGFIFPMDEVPAPMECVTGILRAKGVTKEIFLKLTQIPIVIYYGDYLFEGTNHYGIEHWRIRFEMAKQFVNVINKHGGDAQLVHLPHLGLTGNTHFPMSDLNNVDVARLMIEWLQAKGFSK